MLTPRLETIFHHVSTQNIADVGTDHAYIPIELARSGRIRRAIATDIHEGPLAIAAANVEKYGLQDKIELRLGGGLAPIRENEVEEIIIAGMGGEMIRQILQADEAKAKSAAQLILQPMNAQYELRQWLCANQFKIIKEDIATEGHKVYNIFLVTAGKMPIPRAEIFYHLPESLQNHPKFPALWAKKHREMIRIRTGLLQSANRDEGLILQYTNLLQDLERMKP